MLHRYTPKLIIVALLITAGIWLEFSGLLDVENMLGVARGFADHWWLVVVLILLQMVLFTFALAGSIFLWIVAPLYPPAMAASILAAGATLGGITAYLFSKRLTDDWIRKIEKSHVYKLLHKQDNFFALFALRIFPAFPHSLINYSSGMLKVKLSHFIVAAFAGIFIKSYIYSRVIYNAATSASVEDLLKFSTVAPLILLSLLSLLGLYIKYRLDQKASQQ